MYNINTYFCMQINNIIHKIVKGTLAYMLFHRNKSGFKVLHLKKNRILH